MNEIYDGYIDQVKLGLSIIDICDVGCYTEAKIYMCTV
jgi:hypothetical protein